MKQEIEKQKLNEMLGWSVPEPEAVAGSTKSGNCNTLKMVMGKPFGTTKIGARIMSKITVGGHEVTRNLNEPSDQTIMQQAVKNQRNRQTELETKIRKHRMRNCQRRR